MKWVSVWTTAAGQWALFDAWQTHSNFYYRLTTGYSARSETTAPRVRFSPRGIESFISHCIRRLFQIMCQLSSYANVKMALERIIILAWQTLKITVRNASQYHTIIHIVVHYLNAGFGSFNLFYPKRKCTVPNKSGKSGDWDQVMMHKILQVLTV